MRTPAEPNLCSNGNDQTCDDRYDPTGTFEGMHFEPRCRIWYQDAITPGNTDWIITKPFLDANTGKLILSAAAPVFNPAGNVLGVVGLDVMSSEIESTIKDLTIIDGEGYAYLLAPGGKGVAAVHHSLDDADDAQNVTALEDMDQEELILADMKEFCNGTNSYTRDGEEWLLAWNHETVSRSLTVAAATSGTDDDNVCDGFIVVVTVSKMALWEVSEVLVLS